MSFVARNHKLSTQLRLSSEINENQSLDLVSTGLHWVNRHLFGCKFASKNKNRELVRPFGDVLRFQNHLQSSCSMSFVVRNHKLPAQFRLSFEIQCRWDLWFRYRIHHLIYMGSLGQLASGWVQIRFEIQESWAGATIRRCSTLPKPLAIVL